MEATRSIGWVLYTAPGLIIEAQANCILLADAPIPGTYRGSGGDGQLLGVEVSDVDVLRALLARSKGRRP